MAGNPDKELKLNGTTREFLDRFGKMETTVAVLAERVENHLKHSDDMDDRLTVFKNYVYDGIKSNEKIVAEKEVAAAVLSQKTDQLQTILWWILGIFASMFMLMLSGFVWMVTHTPSVG